MIKHCFFTPCMHYFDCWTDIWIESFCLFLVRNCKYNVLVPWTAVWTVHPCFVFCFSSHSGDSFHSNRDSSRSNTFGISKSSGDEFRCALHIHNTETNALYGPDKMSRWLLMFEIYTNTSQNSQLSASTNTDRHFGSTLTYTHRLTYTPCKNVTRTSAACFSGICYCFRILTANYHK